jgi:hypothetical protein
MADEKIAQETLSAALIRVAEGIEALADTVGKDAADPESAEKTAQVSIRATDYGKVSNNVASRAAGDPLTAWLVGSN